MFAELNWLRLKAGSLSMSELVMLTPIRLAVASTSGVSPVTVTVSATPASSRQIQRDLLADSEHQSCLHGRLDLKAPRRP